MTLDQTQPFLGRWLNGAEGQYNDLGLDPWVTNWFLMLSLVPVLIVWLLFGDLCDSKAEAEENRRHAELCKRKKLLCRQRIGRKR